MSKAKRIIKKSLGSSGRTRPAQETGKRQSRQRPNKAMAHGGSSALVIEGRFTSAERKEVFALLESHGLKATKRNSAARIEEIRDKGNRIDVFVTDSHLALALGKALHAARKGGHLTITWSHDDKPVFVHWMK